MLDFEKTRGHGSWITLYPPPSLPPLRLSLWTLTRPLVREGFCHVFNVTFILMHFIYFLLGVGFYFVRILQDLVGKCLSRKLIFYVLKMVLLSRLKQLTMQDNHNSMVLSFVKLLHPLNKEKKKLSACHFTASIYDNNEGRWLDEYRPYHLYIDQYRLVSTPGFYQSVPITKMIINQFL